MVVTQSASNFFELDQIRTLGIPVFTDQEEWDQWEKKKTVLHIDLRKWADILLIAPLSANTLGKIANGLSDNLLTCVVRAWDYNKPFFVAPAMNTMMFENPFTEKHYQVLRDFKIEIIPTVVKKLACGDFGNGAMSEVDTLVEILQPFIK